jgi:hypothetical protein
LLVIRSSNGQSVPINLAFSCPFDETKSRKRQQAAAQTEGRQSPDSMSDDAVVGQCRNINARKKNGLFSSDSSGALLKGV